MLRVWITGAKGNVGSALSSLLDTSKYQLFLTDLDLDITNEKEVIQFIRINRPDVIINCAGVSTEVKTPQDRDEMYKVNVIGLRNIAIAASEIGAKVIQLSTDDVFSTPSELPYNEFDEISPDSVYGKSKASAEKMLTEMTNRFVIVRSSWVYGIGEDFVNIVLDAAESGTKLEVPDNEIASPTSAEELAKVLYFFIDHDEVGIYHVVCKGQCSRYEFAEEILKISGKTANLKKVSLSSPKYTVLDNMMLRLTGIPEPIDWKEALKNHLS